jgi:hypothetical protein
MIPKYISQTTKKLTRIVNANQAMALTSSVTTETKDVEITPTMIGAGVIALGEASSNMTGNPTDWGMNAVKSIYHAMETAKKLESGLTPQK